MAKEELKQLRADKPVGDYPWWDPSKDVKEDVKLHISLPTYSGGLNLNQDGALKHALMNSTLGDRLKVEFNYIAKDSLVCRARDKLAAAFLVGDCEWQPSITFSIQSF